MFSYLNRPRRNILELLADFPHALAHLPYSLLFELFAPIKPREFSIASSPLVSKMSLKKTEDQLSLLENFVKH